MRSSWRTAAHALVAFVCLFSATPALAQAGSPEVQPNPEATAKAMRSLHWADELEELLAQRALERSRTPKVQRFAERAIHDHAVADERLLTIAARLGVDLEPTAAEQQARAEQVALMFTTLDEAGAGFDHEYLRVMEESHKASIRQLARLRREVDSEELRDLLTLVLPILEQHLTLARKLRIGQTT